MNKIWSIVVLAAVFEVGWVIGLKHSNQWLEWTGTLIAIFVSFYLLILASRKLPVGTTYAVFVGLGTAGTVLADTWLFGAALQLEKIVLIGVLLIGVIGLKLVSDKKEGEVKES